MTQEMKQKRSSKRRSNILTILLYTAILITSAFVFFYFGAKVDQQMFMRNRAKSELAKAQARYEAVREERLKYEEAVKKLKNKEYVELIARKKLKMVKPGEKAYIVVYEGETPESSDESILEMLTSDKR